ncbi:MAG: hypothetical protein GY861_26440 [bacterium]|nr:hypothetical protein [bacterium]
MKELQATVYGNECWIYDDGDIEIEFETFGIAYTVYTTVAELKVLIKEAEEVLRGEI